MIVFKINPSTGLSQDELYKCLSNFKSSGKDFVIGNRNAIKTFEIKGAVLNIKSFRIPNLINKVVYKYFRKSKARRSFEYANILIENNIGTPKPIAYYERFGSIGLNESYYICQHIQADLTYRELVQSDYPDNGTILRQFTRFSYDLHEKGIEFLDHSPGNTLIKKKGDGHYDFYLVDLNRMNFHQNMSFELRMKNLSRLTPKKEMVAIMSEEYAKLYQKSEQEVFEKMWFYTNEFQEKYYRKKRLKKRFLFWK